MKEEKRSEILQDALQYLDEELIAEVNRLRGGVVEDEQAVLYESGEIVEAEEGKHCQTGELMDESMRAGSEQDKQRKESMGVESHPNKFAKVLASEDKQMRILDNERKKSTFSWRRWVALAAGVCVLFSVTWIWNTMLGSDKDMTGNAENEYADSFMNKESAMESKSEYAESDDAAGDQTNDGNDVYSDKNNSGADDEVMDSNQDFIKEEVVGTPKLEQPEQELPGDAAVVPEAEGVRIPAMKVDLKKEDLASDMVAFFIHKGRCYVQDTEVREDDSFVGDYVGTSRGLIDEWTPQEGYVDGSGSISGTYYEVKGIDPGFMLCMKYPDGKVEVYVNDNGITLNKGADLVDDRLHLRGNWNAAAFQTQESYNSYGNEPLLLAEEHHAVLEEFLNALAEGEFTYLDGVTYSPSLFGEEKNNAHIYHLYFTKNEGIRLQFVLLGDGRVMFSGLRGVCVQMDETIYEKVVDVLQKQAN